MSRIGNCGAPSVDGTSTNTAPANTSIQFGLEVVIVNQDDVEHEVEVVGRVGGQEFDRRTVTVHPPGTDVRLEGAVQTGASDMDITVDIVRDVALAPEPTNGTSDGGDSGGGGGGGSGGLLAASPAEVLRRRRTR